ncbi:MAG: secretin N-terminal domain-containing protein [Planctomycetota bacterium]
MHISGLRCAVWIVLLASLGGVGAARAQPPAAAPGEPPPGMVRFNLQGNIRLQALIDIVSQRLDMKFIYSAPIGDRPINVKAPSEVPVDALPALLSSVLKMENLLLIDADVPGWKRIVDAGEMAQVARPGEAEDVLARNGPAAPVTQAFAIEYIPAQQLATVIRPFLKQPGSNVLAVTESNTLVVTDYAPNVLTVERLIKLIDRPRGEVVYDFYTVVNTEAQPLAEQVGAMLGARPAAPAEAAPPGPAVPSVELFAEPRTNQVVVVGPGTSVEQAVQLLRRFDVSLGVVNRVYRFQYVKAERIDRIIKSSLPPQDADRAYRGTVDEEGNLLVVRATPEVHQQIEQLQQQLDVPIKVEESPIRFYKLKNANALDVLYTLLALQEVAGTPGVLGGGGAAPAAAPGAAGATTPLSININSSSQALPQYPVNPLPLAAALPGEQYPYLPTLPAYPNRPLPLPLPPEQDMTGTYDSMRQARVDRLAGVLAPQLATGGAAALPGGARVTANVATNSLIIVAPTEIQNLYARLIQALDVRQPQVLIEAKIVAIDTTDNFSLGVEFSVGDRNGAKRLFAFDSFGLSEVDPITGALKIIPAFGFNGTLVDPEVADVVVQALSAHTRARVLAAPRILVNDNTTGELESVTSIPFASVNASQTVSTTSLGGSQQAGTLITVTPHIKENEQLQLEFSIEFSTFSSTDETTDATLPPPRQIDRVGSVVNMPNGKTVIVGGLKRVGATETFLGLPIIENVPVLRELTSSTTKQATTTSFFVFIRPIILVDDRYADLQYLSAKEAECAGIPHGFPTSRPIVVE